MMRRKLCKHCKGKLEPGQYIHPACVVPYAEAEGAKAERKKAKQMREAQRLDKASDREKKERIKTLPVLKREAQQAFNAWIRYRDRDQPCISCCAPPPDMSKLHGGRDAGHFRSVGSASNLRYHEDNCHAQCVSCNQYGAGRAVDYRIGLVARIGLERVEALERQNAARKWTHDEVRAIRDEYRARMKKSRVSS